MEEVSDRGGGQGRWGGEGPPPSPFSLAASSKLSVQVYTVPSSASSGGAAAAMAHASGSGSGHLGPPLLGDDDSVRAKIVSHPRYHRLVAAFLDCHKVGCSPEEADGISASVRELEARQRAAAAGAHAAAGPDPELDQFMECYCELLAAGKEELSRPLREAEEFLRAVESELNSITSAGPHLISAAEKNGLDPSVDDDEQEEAGSGMDGEESLGIGPCSDDKELKRHLLRKYSGCLGSLRKELCKKRKKGKLPKEARQKLLSWWELHYRWPYPSEIEKIALAESTGLEQKQINNWFINQRKRHWKPSEEMQFAVMDCFHHHNHYPAVHQQDAAALYLDARLVGASPAMLYGSCCHHGAHGHGHWHS